jgi:hypothetical protein
MKALYVFGTALGIIGGLILFKYGLPADVSKHGHIGYIAAQDDPQEAAKWNRYWWYSRLGLFFVLTGSIVQAIASVSG